MSQYPEADEAQHRHYNDGYNPYHQQPQGPQGTPSPYEHYDQRPLSGYDDPFYGHPSHPSSPPPPQPGPPQLGQSYPPRMQYAGSPPPPPQLDAYGAPIAPPHPSLSPHPHPSLSPHPPHPSTSPFEGTHDYLTSPFQPPRTVTPAASSTYLNSAGSVHGRQTYALTDGGANEHEDDHLDSGDIPLLSRNRNSLGATSTTAFSMPAPNLPGSYPGAPGSFNDSTFNGSYAAGGSYGEGGLGGSYGDGFVGGFAEDGEESNIRYGRIPQRVPRRYKTIKKVELFHGNFVLDQEVPKKLLEMCPLKSEREYTHMRYSAATCDPNDFKDSGFTLRQVHYDPPRRTELFIVMTMYNEDEELFCRTMSGVMKNVAHLCSRERSKTWGKEGWKKVVVCVVSDGRMKVNSRTLSVLAAMGVYQEGVGKNKIFEAPVTAHIYEYTTQISISPSLKIEGAEKGIVPVQIIFCLKEKNQKKINSHRWFFNAFGPILQPNVCVLLDVGTMPGVTSIYHLWKAFDINSNVGGACGEIVALKGKWGVNLLNPLVAAQNFEYKMSNILDKPLESVFGYITVLPGAFSAYRYIALQNDSVGEGPLQKYFLGEKMHGAGADIFTANMYLAEDRILCWELVSKRGGSWILHYVKSAYAITDVPDQVPELISQRRRWLNGSFFAAVHSTVHFHYIYRSAHGFMRKAWIHVELVYQTFNLVFSWFGLANYYIAFTILSNALEDTSFNLKGIHIVNLILNYFYMGLLILCFLLSMGNRPQGSKWGYTLAILGFGVITIYMTFAAFFLAFKGIKEVSDAGSITFTTLFQNKIFGQIVLSLLATLGLYLLSSLLFFEPWHMITSFVQYLLMAPSYIAVLNVYAFANVHDVSWGTKGDNKVSTDLGVVTAGKDKSEGEANLPTDAKDIDSAYQDAVALLRTKAPKVDSKPDAATVQEDYYRTFRTNVLLAWTLSNGLLGAIVVTANDKAADSGANKAVTGYMTFLLYSVAGLAFVRFVGSTMYMIIRLFAGE